MVAKKQEEPIEAEIIIEKKVRAYKHHDDGMIFVGILFVAIGGLFFIQSYFGINVWSLFWPIILIIIGLLLIFKRRG